MLLSFAWDVLVHTAVTQAGTDDLGKITSAISSSVDTLTTPQGGLYRRHKGLMYVGPVMASARYSPTPCQVTIR